jgi:hypothetical protein
MNVYCHLGLLKSSGMLNVTGTDYDSELLRIAEDSSRRFDKDTDRFFYIYEGTMIQEPLSSRVLLSWDVQTVTSLTVDNDGDNTYENTYTVDINSPTTSPDAVLQPRNRYPKTRMEVGPGGSYGDFGSQFAIVGTFGHGNDWPASNTRALDSKVGAALTSTGTTVYVTASTASEIQAGMTLRIGSEQVYVNAQPTASSVPITRAANGTAASAATASTAMSVYQYPAPVVQAVLIQTVRSWKRRESGYQNNVVNLDMGGVSVWKGNDPDYDTIVKRYRKVSDGYFG